MCGISGILNHKDESTRVRFVEKSKEFHQFRGPDNFGTWTDQKTLFTHSRLSVIDLSEKGNQPMLSENQNLVITFNGEIYNHRSLQNELGINTSSDTAVILAAIEAWGIEKTLTKLKGMFAFCVYDQQKDKYFLARDRFGQKPLYYHFDQGELFFASDIRVLHGTIKEKLSLNYCSMGYYLSELATPQPNTIWNEIEQIQPGHYAILDNTNLEHIKYWELNTTVSYKDENDLLDLTDQRLNKAIQRRLESDLDVGCFLSGGVDSGLIVSMLAQQSQQAVKTFTVGFDYGQYNELEQARRIVERYQTNHTEIKVDTSVKDDIENILHQFGEPFADSSAIPTYYISKETKKHLTVVLSGDGGDELFAGYFDYALSREADLYREKISSPLLRKTNSVLSKVTSRISSSVENKGMLEFWLKIKPPFNFYRHMGFSPHEWLLNKGDHEFAQKYWQKIWDESKADSYTERLMIGSTKTRLLNDYLVKIDRASMANSLEIRSPFMDDDLADLAFSIPIEQRMKDGHSKYVLKKLGEKYMYNDIFQTEKKGFEMPLKNWLKDDLYELAADHITDLSKREHFKAFKGMDLLNQHKAGTENHTHRIWALIALEIWMKKFYD